MSTKTEAIKEEVREEQETPLTVEETIVQVLDAYLKQEMGNKVSQFSVQGLMSLMLGSLEQLK